MITFISKPFCICSNEAIDGIEEKRKKKKTRRNVYNQSRCASDACLVWHISEHFKMFQNIGTFELASKSKWRIKKTNNNNFWLGFKQQEET